MGVTVEAVSTGQALASPLSFFCFLNHINSYYEFPLKHVMRILCENINTCSIITVGKIILHLLEETFFL